MPERRVAPPDYHSQYPDWGGLSQEPLYADVGSTLRQKMMLVAGIVGVGSAFACTMPVNQTCTEIGPNGTLVQVPCSAEIPATLQAGVTEEPSAKPEDYCQRLENDVKIGKDNGLLELVRSAGKLAIRVISEDPTTVEGVIRALGDPSGYGLPFDSKEGKANFFWPENCPEPADAPSK